LKYLKVIAFTHKQIDLKDLGKFVICNESLESSLESVRQKFDIPEIFYIGTCNRVEFVFTAEQNLTHEFVKDFIQALNLPISEEQAHTFSEQVSIYEDEDALNNPLFSPCKCAGTMKYIHLNCLQDWLNSRMITKETPSTKTYFWKNLECELCKTPFENQMKGKLFQIMDFERPDDDYLIMESVKSAPAKVIHVFFLDKGNEFKIGRSVETDMKIADISVSRVHSLIKIRDK
jgi:hypothetical protein